MELLNKVLLQIFAAQGGPQTGTPLVEISTVVGKGLIDGTYPLVNMFVALFSLKNPDSPIFLAVTVAAIVEALKAQVPGGNVKQ
jgi:hypothetical protein